MAPRDSRSCPACGRPLAYYARADARYCSTPCRLAAWRHEYRRATDVVFRIVDDHERAVAMSLGGRAEE